MGDFFTGMTYGDQLEMGTAIVGGGMDNEALNAMIRQEMDERALAAQVQKHGPGHGRDAVSQAVAPGATPTDSGQVCPVRRGVITGIHVRPYARYQDVVSSSAAMPSGIAPLAARFLLRTSSCHPTSSRPSK